MPSLVAATATSTHTPFMHTHSAQTNYRSHYIKSLILEQLGLSSLKIYRVLKVTKYNIRNRSWTSLFECLKLLQIVRKGEFLAKQLIDKFKSFNVCIRIFNLKIIILQYLLKTSKQQVLGNFSFCFVHSPLLFV